MSSKMPSQIFVTYMVCSTPLARIVEVRVPGDLHPDTRDLVRRFAEALAKKLRASELKYGYSNGWKDPGCVEELRGKLAEHVTKGDPVDVAAFCAMLWHHGEHCRPKTTLQEELTEDAPRLKELTDRLDGAGGFTGMSCSERHELAGLIRRNIAALTAAEVIA